MATLWDVVPFERCGPLEFGMTRDQTRAILGADFDAYQKFQGPTGLIDIYRDLGVFLFYDENGGLRFVEVNMPCVPTYKGVRLATNGVANVLKAMTAIGEPPVEDFSAYRFDRLGIMLYVPDGERLELVSIASRNEYEKVLNSIKRRAEKRAAQKGPPIAPPRMDWSTAVDDSGESN